MSEGVNWSMSEGVNGWMGQGVNEGSESMNDGIMEWIYFEMGHPVLVMAD